MAKGTLRLDHRMSCALHDSAGARQFDSRKCSCSPRVIGRLNGRGSALGYLQPAWKKRDLAEFEDKLADLRDPNRRKRAARSPLLREWYEDWIVDMRAAVAQGKLAPRTVDAYEQRWRRHIAKDALADMPINAIGARDLRRFVSRKIAAGASHRYANELLTPISGMLTDAEIEGYIESNPCRVSRRARHGATQRSAVYEQLERRPPQHLELETARALIMATPLEFRLRTLWPLVTGARRAEMLGAHFDDVGWAKRELAIHYQLDAKRKRVTVKHGRRREVALWSGLERLLAAQRREGRGTWIFPNAFGGPLSLSGADKVLRDASRRSGRSKRDAFGMPCVTRTRPTCDRPVCVGRRSST